MILITEFVDDLVRRAKLADGIKPDYVRAVYSETDLLDQNKLVTPPFVGVMYEGLRSNPQKDGGNMGRGAVFYAAILLGCLTKSIGNHDNKPESAALLDAIRDKILGDRSPSQHRWSFISEMYMGDIQNISFYAQRWSAPVILAR